MSAFVVGIVLDGGRKQRVDKGSLAKARLSSNLIARALAMPSLGLRARRQQFFFMVQKLTSSYHNSEARTTLSNNLVSLVGQVGDANWRGALGAGRSHLDRQTRDDLGIQGRLNDYREEEIHKQLITPTSPPRICCCDRLEIKSVMG